MNIGDFLLKFSQDNNSIQDTPELMEIRKEEHITICKTKNVESKSIRFNSVHLQPEALPEMDFGEVSTRASFLGHDFSLPIFITGMTGGVKNGQEINEILAVLAQEFNIPMGLGSQKMLLADSKFTPLFNTKKVAPKAFIIGNIGAVSLNYGVTTADIAKKFVNDLELNAFALHLNALQECIQPEGERNFKDLLKKIEHLVKELPVPVIVKEVGSGISGSTLKKLMEVGVQAVDVGGNGGTSWSAIEGFRNKQSHGQRLGELFRDWGLSTEESLKQCVLTRKEFKSKIELDRKSVV